METKNIIKIDTTSIGDAIPVENFGGVLQYICADFKRSIKLTTYLKDELTQLFGKHNTRYRGEFFYYVWIVEFDGEEYTIFTAKDKGTQFSIVSELGEDKSRTCINFLKKMEGLLDSKVPITN